jgi:hypothetical protein
MDKQSNTSTATKCIATTSSGQACQSFTVGGSEYCFAHDPALRAKRKQARSAGGKARHRRHITWADDELRASVRIRSVADVLALLERATVDELRLENSHSRNRTIASLATAALKALEVGELERRLEALEAAYEQQS